VGMSRNDMDPPDIVLYCVICWEHAPNVIFPNCPPQPTIEHVGWSLIVGARGRAPTKAMVDCQLSRRLRKT
jgi:hypothetical protein